MASVFGFNFDSASAASVGLDVAGGIGSFISARAARSVSRANAEAANMVREAQNKQREANARLSETMRRINNARVARATAEAGDAVQAAAIRASQSYNRGDLERGLRESEQLGAATAQAAAAGVGGNSVEAVRQTMQLRNARLEQAIKAGQDTQQYDFIRQRAGVVERGIQSADLRPITSNLDLSVNTAQGGPSLVSSLLGNLLGSKESRATLNTFLGSISQTPTASYGSINLGPDAGGQGSLGSGTYDTSGGFEFFTQPQSPITTL